MPNRTWTYHDTTTTLAHAAAANLMNFTAGLQSQLGYNPSDYTCQRIVGHVQLLAPAGATPYDSAKIFLGILPVDSDATAAGAYPEPFADSLQWMWTHGGLVSVPDNPSASLATLLIPDHVASPHLDIQTNRRIRGRSENLCLVGYDDSGISGTLNVSVTARVLWKLNS